MREPVGRPESEGEHGASEKRENVQQDWSKSGRRGELRDEARVLRRGQNSQSLVELAEVWTFPEINGDPLKDFRQRSDMIRFLCQRNLTCWLSREARMEPDQLEDHCGNPRKG